MYAGKPKHWYLLVQAVTRHDITIDENIYGGMTPHELSQAQEKELQLAQRDIMMERTKDKKNSLESYVYEARNKVQIYALPGIKSFNLILLIMV